MTKLLEIKERLVRFCEEYETYVKMLGKFAVALSIFLVIDMNIGYNAKLSSIPVALVLALVCCLLPQSITLVLAGLIVCADMYSLCIEAALVTVVLFLIVLLVYFRFTSKGINALLLTPVSFKLGVQYIMPIGTGLLGEAYTVISVVCGTVVYYFFKGIHQNAGILVAPLEDSKLSNFDIVINQLISNKEMMLVIGVFVVASIVTYLVRRMDTDNSWIIAIIAGAAIQIVGLLAGYIIMGFMSNIPGLIIGGIISILLGFIILFFFMNLDYARVERAQFEDDEYYYYVKAIPKKIVKGQEKVVKHYGNTGSMGKRIDRKRENDMDDEVSKKVFAQEMDIDEDLLK